MRAIWKRSDVEAGLVPIQPLHGGATEPVPVSRLAAPDAPAPGGDEAIARHLRLLNTLAKGLVAERSSQLRALRPELLSLLMLVCRELLGREVATDPAIVEHTLGKALESLRGATRVTARLHPDDIEWLRGTAADVAAGVELLPDPSLERGECLLDSERGSIDATWETQLRLVREALSWDTREADA